jgi:hypothetical protein
MRATPSKVTLSLTLGILVACQPASTLLSGQDNAFFANSLRRGPLVGEGNVQAILNMSMGCAGFFVGNDAGRVLVMSASHCMQAKPREWCESETNYAVDQEGQLRRCLGTVVAESGSDLALFEFSGPAPAATLALLEGGATKRRRLVMYGYPVDAAALDGLNVTENCWITADADRNLRQDNPEDLNYLHNCSTYGGNSGGPMVVEGTRALVGEPQSYRPNDPTQYPSDGDFFAWGTDVTPFIRRNRATLDTWGVEIVDDANDALLESPTAITLHSGTYKGEGCLENYSTTLRAKYNSRAELNGLALRWTESDGNFTRVEYDCAGSLCVQRMNGGEAPGTEVVLQGRDRIEYRRSGQEFGCVLNLSKIGYY